MAVTRKETYKNKKGVLKHPKASLGLVIPFQPSMWDDEYTKAVLAYTVYLAEEEIQSKHRLLPAHNIPNRLQKLLSSLNFTTLRKSLALILSPDKEKIIYLNFPVNTFISIFGSFSLFDLVGAIKNEPAFYLFFINEKSKTLYEYLNGSFNKVYEQNKSISVNTRADAERKAAETIAFINNELQKPVFLVGKTELLTQFLQSSPHPEIFFTIEHTETTDSTVKKNNFVQEVLNSWNDWLSKFYVLKIIVAKKTNQLISTAGPVLAALCKNADGLLLIDKRLKKKLQNSTTRNSLFMPANNLTEQIELFLERGNKFEFTEAGLLSNWGDIVLIRDKFPDNSDNRLFSDYGNHTKLSPLF